VPGSPSAVKFSGLAFEKGLRGRVVRRGVHFAGFKGVGATGRLLDGVDVEIKNALDLLLPARASGLEPCQYISRRPYYEILNKPSSLPSPLPFSPCRLQAGFSIKFLCSIPRRRRKKIIPSSRSRPGAARKRGPVTRRAVAQRRRAQPLTGSRVVLCWWIG